MSLTMIECSAVNVDEMRKQIVDLEANIITYKSQIVSLENKVAKMGTLVSEHQIKHDQEIAKLKATSDVSLFLF